MISLTSTSGITVILLINLLERNIATLQLMLEKFKSIFYIVCIAIVVTVVYLICIAIPQWQCNGQGVLMYHIFSNTRVGMPRTSFTFTS